MLGVRITSFVAAVALASVGLVGAQATSAATAPSVKMTQPIFHSITPDNGASSYPDTWDVAFTLPWTVTAPNGVCGQTITDQDYNDLGGDTHDPILGYNTATYTLPKSARSYSGGDGYWLDFFRGGYNAYIQVTECNGVKVNSNAVHTVIQPGDDQDAQMSYSGSGWKIAKCTCFPGGTSHYTSIKNASVSFVTAQPIDPTGIRLALVMPKGPGRGSAAVYVDNKYKATINTYMTGANVNGAIVYQTLLVGTHTHVVRIVNLATAGHPRIDLDATINGG